jgi:hypothetical protein
LTSQDKTDRQLLYFGRLFPRIIAPLTSYGMRERTLKLKLLEIQGRERCQKSMYMSLEAARQTARRK